MAGVLTHLGFICQQDSGLLQSDQDHLQVANISGKSQNAKKHGETSKQGYADSTHIQANEAREKEAA